MSDPRLDRRQEFDPRSRNFQIRTLFTEPQLTTMRSFTWRMPVNDLGNFPLDQGSEGACVGFAWAHELALRPRPDKYITSHQARQIYLEAQRVDEWPGENYDGTSVIAGAKVLEKLGKIKEYRWAGAGSGTAVDDLFRAIAYKGPAVLGTNWYTGMFRPDTSGRLHVTGQIEGGHAIVAPRVTGPRYIIPELRDRIYLYNSWGRHDGWPTGWLTRDDMERLLEERGEACIPIVRG